MAYPILQETISQTLGIHGPACLMKAKDRPKVSFAKEPWADGSAFLKPAKRSAEAEVKPAVKASQWHSGTSFMARTGQSIRGWTRP